MVGRLSKLTGRKKDDDSSSSSDESDVSPITPRKFARKLSCRYKKKTEETKDINVERTVETYEITIGTQHGDVVLPAPTTSCGGVSPTIIIHTPGPINPLPGSSMTIEQLAKYIAKEIDCDENQMLGILFKAQSQPNETIEASISPTSAIESEVPDNAINHEASTDNTLTCCSNQDHVHDLVPSIKSVQPKMTRKSVEVMTTSGASGGNEEQSISCSSSRDPNGNIKITWQVARTKVAEAGRQGAKPLSKACTMATIFTLVILIIVMVLNRLQIL